MGWSPGSCCHCPRHRRLLLLTCRGALALSWRTFDKAARTSSSKKDETPFLQRGKLRHQEKGNSPRKREEAQRGGLQQVQGNTNQEKFPAELMVRNKSGAGRKTHSFRVTLPHPPVAPPSPRRTQGPPEKETDPCSPATFRSQSPHFPGKTAQCSQTTSPESLPQGISAFYPTTDSSGMTQTEKGRCRFLITAPDVPQS